MDFAKKISSRVVCVWFLMGLVWSDMRFSLHSSSISIIIIFFAKKKKMLHAKESEETEIQKNKLV